MMDKQMTKLPEWTIDLKKRAWDAYNDLPLPDRVDHIWRYTDPGLFIPDGDPHRISPQPAEHELAPWCEVCNGDFRGDDRILGIMVNEWTHTVSLPEELANAGVRLMDLSSAIREHEDLVEPHFARLIPGEVSKLEALNLATWHGGFYLYLPPDVRIEEPVHLFVNDRGEGSFFAPRILVVMGRGSAMTLFTEFTSRSDSEQVGRQVNSAIEIVQGEASQLQHITVQRLSRSINSYLASRAFLEKDARLLSVLTAFGGATSKVDTGALMAGPGAESKLIGFAFGEANQHLDHHTVYDHQAPHTRSDLDFKVVLKGKARSAFTGLLRIAREAPYCEAFQENRNILLSDQARADTIPELEILTDEVRCSHGATVGPLDSDHLFYLMSRGIAREDAVRMIVGGFLEPTLVEIPGKLRAKVRLCVNERLREF
jgi:Fe-S cluster assembly protein SufD